MIKAIDPANHSTITQYDEANNVISVTDANGNRTSYEYDKLNRQTRIIDANNVMTQWTEYDGFGNIKSITDSGGNVTRYEYDQLNRQTKMTDPSNKSINQDYDGLSRVQWISDRNNRLREFTYDINDQLLTESWNGNAALQFTYDKLGNLTTSKDFPSDTTNTYDYDAIYQVIDATTGNVRFHYDYDVYGDLTQRQEWVNGLLAESIAYQYDKTHLLERLTKTGVGMIAQDFQFENNEFGELTKVTRSTSNSPGKFITDYQYYNSGLTKDINSHFDQPNVINPTSLTVKSISNYHYAYDPGNRLKDVSGSNGTSAIAYEKDNQLKSIHLVRGDCPINSTSTMTQDIALESDTEDRSLFLRQQDATHFSPAKPLNHPSA